MPQAIPAAVAAAKNFFIAKFITVAGVQITYATIAKVALVAAAYATSRQQMKKALRSLGTMDASRSVSVREPTAARRILYGQMRMGGTIVFADTSGTNNEYLHLVIAHCEGPIEEIGDVYLNDEVVPLDGSGNATGKYAGYVTVIKHLGTTTQTVDTALQTAVGAGTWSNNHRLRGIACSYVRLKHNPDLFPSGLPNYSAILKGRNDIYDPRTTTTGYSTNSALCLRHYLLLAKADGGLGASASEIDEAAVQTAANVCDESVNLNPSGTESRYTTNGIVDTSSAPGVVIESLCSAMAGICPYIGGKFKPKAGAHTASVFSFTEDDIVGAVQFQTRDSMRDAFNGVKGTYVTADNDYQVSDFPPVVNSTYTTEDGGSRIWKDITLGFTTSSATAQRIAKIELERSRQDIVVTIETKLGAIDAHAGDVVDLTLARYGWTSKLFEVTSCQFVVGENADGPTLGLRWTLRETAAAVWDWNSGEETVVDVAPSTDLPDLYTVATLSGLTLSQAGFLQTDGTWQPRLLASWTAATDTYVLNGGAVNLEYKATTSTTWLIRDGAIRGDATSAYITDVTAGASADVRGRFENVRFVRGAYSSTASMTAASDTTAPSAPTSITYIGGSAAGYGRAPSTFSGVVQRSIRVNWTAPTAKDLAYYEWVDTSSDTDAAATAATPKNVTTDTEVIIAASIWATSYFRVRAIDRSGNASSWAGGGTNMDGVAGYAAGNMSNQNNSAVNVSGGQAILGGFEANVTTAVDVKAVNLRVYDSGATQKLRVDNTTGDVYVQSTKVLSTRVGSTPVTLGDVISVLQHHGLSD